MKIERLCGVVLALACQPAWAQTAPKVMQRAEDCLRANVDRVATNEPDLESAASFLVDFVCAKEVSAATRYTRNQLVASQFNAVIKSVGTAPKSTDPPANPAAQAPNWNYTISVDPETGDFVFPRTSSSGGNPGAWALYVLPQVRDALGNGDPNPTPNELRVLAGDLVLAAHERLAGRH